MTAEEITRSLVRRVHALTGENIAETARRTGLDRRTVIKRLKRSKARAEGQQARNTIGIGGRPTGPVGSAYSQ